MNPFAHFRHSKNKNSVALFAVAMIAVGFGASGCAKLKARDLLNKGVAAYRDGKYDAGDRVLQASEGYRSHADQRPPVSRHGLCHAVHSRRAFGRKHSHGRGGRQGIPGRALRGCQQYLRDRRYWLHPLQHGRHSLHAEPLRGIQDLSHEAHRPEAGRSRALLLDRRDRLDAYLSRQPRSARNMAPGACRQSRSRTTTRCRPMFATITSRTTAS